MASNDEIEDKKMKWKTIVFISAVLLLCLLGAAFVCSFHVRRVAYCADGFGEIALPKGKVVREKYIYPTKLVSVDPNQMGAEIAVVIPGRGWVTFHGQKNEIIKGTGCFIYEIEPEQIKIRFFFSKIGHEFIWE